MLPQKLQHATTLSSRFPFPRRLLVGILHFRRADGARSVGFFSMCIRHTVCVCSLQLPIPHSFPNCNGRGPGLHGNFELYYCTSSRNGSASLVLISNRCTRKVVHWRVPRLVPLHFSWCLKKGPKALKPARLPRPFCRRNAAYLWGAWRYVLYAPAY